MRWQWHLFLFSREFHSPTIAWNQGLGLILNDTHATLTTVANKTMWQFHTCSMAITLYYWRMLILILLFCNRSLIPRKYRRVHATILGLLYSQPQLYSKRVVKNRKSNIFLQENLELPLKLQVAQNKLVNRLSIRT